MCALSLDELETLEQEANTSEKVESEKLLKVSAALREALQAKVNAEAMVDLLLQQMNGGKPTNDPHKRNSH